MRSLETFITALHPHTSTGMTDTQHLIDRNMPPLTINWPLSSLSGYGIYGLQILMHYLRRGGRHIALTDRVVMPLDMPSPFDQFLTPMLENSERILAFLRQNPEEKLVFNHPVLHGIGNSFTAFTNQYRVEGKLNIGCAAIEIPSYDSAWVSILKRYDMFIAISRWNATFLQSLNLAPVHLCHQGIDTSLFYAVPRRETWPGRFVVFSGGKFEFRKGQDIVTAVFKIFHARHPDALLVTAWQNTAISNPETLLKAGHCTTLPEKTAEPSRGLKIKEWLLSQGLPENSFIELPWVHNRMIPEILQACDVALFPNRCEGGTNLVAMEAMACGIPTYVSYNTGHKDLVDLLGFEALRIQAPVQASAELESVTEWGESDLDEVLLALETTYTKAARAREKALVTAEKLKSWDWATQNERLLRIVIDGAS